MSGVAKGGDERNRYVTGQGDDGFRNVRTPLPLFVFVGDPTYPPLLRKKHMPRSPESIARRKASDRLRRQTPAYKAKVAAYREANRERLNALALARYHDNPERSRAYYRANRERMLALSRAAMERNKIETKAWLSGFRQTISCSRCPEDDGRCLDFHHPDPSEKKDDVSELVARGQSLRVVRAEIAKCVVLCANCHRMEHALPADRPGPRNPEKRRRLEWFADLKAGLACECCSESRSPCLGFFRGGERVGAKLSRMVKDGAARSRILEEIASSRVLCFNCYRKGEAGLRRKVA